MFIAAKIVNSDDYIYINKDKIIQFEPTSLINAIKENKLINDLKIISVLYKGSIIFSNKNDLETNDRIKKNYDEFYDDKYINFLQIITDKCFD